MIFVNVESYMSKTANERRGLRANSRSFAGLRACNRATSLTILKFFTTLRTKTMAAVRSALVRLGFTQDAAKTMVEDQGITDLHELEILCDKELKLLCYVCRRPGGTIANPNPDTQGNINNPGNQISVRAETNLKLAAYYIRHRLHRTSRPVTPGDITLEAVRGLITLRDFEGNNPAFHTKHYEGAPTADLKDWVRTLEALDVFLTETRGERNIPLYYVVRKEVAVKPDDEDPSTNYSTIAAEMIARAPHGDNETYEMNNGKVLDVMSQMFRTRLRGLTSNLSSQRETGAVRTTPYLGTTLAKIVLIIKRPLPSKH